MAADEFLQHHVHDDGIELVNGEVIWLAAPGLEHRKVCAKVIEVIGGYVAAQRIGQLVAGGRLLYGRATVRRVDASLVRDPGCRGVAPAAEFLIVVRSPFETIREAVRRAYDCLDVGVKLVLVFDPLSKMVGVFRAEEFPYRFEGEQVLNLPDVLPGFAVPVRQFFE